MEEYKSNSHILKEQKQGADLPEKKVEKIISGNAKSKKKNKIKKLADVFITEDINSVKEYFITDVLIPTVKKAVSDILSNGLDMVFYGERGSKKKSGVIRPSYSGYYDKRDERNIGTNKARIGYSYDDIVLDSRGEAEEVLSKMDELISVYGLVSVADLYDLVGISGSHTDNKYGWTDIRNAEAVRVRDGYLLKLPRALPLN